MTYRHCGSHFIALNFSISADIRRGPRNLVDNPAASCDREASSWHTTRCPRMDFRIKDLRLELDIMRLAVTGYRDDKWRIRYPGVFSALVIRHVEEIHTRFYALESCFPIRGGFLRHREKTIRIIAQ